MQAVDSAGSSDNYSMALTLTLTLCALGSSNIYCVCYPLHTTCINYSVHKDNDSQKKATKQILMFQLDALAFLGSGNAQETG